MEGIRDRGWGSGKIGNRKRGMKMGKKEFRNRGWELGERGNRKKGKRQRGKRERGILIIIFAYIGYSSSCPA